MHYTSPHNDTLAFIACHPLLTSVAPSAIIPASTYKSPFSTNAPSSQLHYEFNVGIPEFTPVLNHNTPPTTQY